MALSVPGAVAVGLANPFTVAPGRLGLARTRLLDEPGQALASLLAREAMADAERLVLAVGHQQALQQPVPKASVVLDERTFPRRFTRRLPRSRAAYLRVVLGAARCHACLSELLGHSAALQRLRAEVWASCFGESLVDGLELESVIHDHDVLLLGETGTGKEVVAQAFLLAKPGGSDGGPAAAATLNVAAIPETLVESALFGHVRGAFTGADQDRIGRIRSAHGGCFFLDEVGDLPATAQVKLLRVMETDTVTPIGSDRDQDVDVRYVSATHKDLPAMVEAGAFRRDLYQRLAGRVIELPPLRERPEDIAEIGLGFFDRYAGKLAGVEERRDRVAKWLASRAVRAHPWTGNVRELQNALRSLLLGLDPELVAGSSTWAVKLPSLPPKIRDNTASLREVEDWYLARVLESTGDNYAETSRILGIDRSTARRRARSLDD